METGRDLETIRARCFELAAAAFSSDQLDLDLYESLAGTIAVAETAADLEVIRKNLPEVIEPPKPPVQIVEARASSMRKSGRWLDSPLVALKSKGSSVVLDFTEYADERKLRVNLDLDCTGTSLTIVVPPGIDVVERIAESRASVFRDKRRRTEGDGAILITGAITGSRVKIKRKKAR